MSAGESAAVSAADGFGIEFLDETSVKPNIQESTLGEDVDVDYKRALENAAVAGLITGAAAYVYSKSNAESVSGEQNIYENAHVLDKPKQVHHFATNKNKIYTPQFEEIAKKYGLDLDDIWNKKYMSHQGRHPNEYHQFVLDRMRQYDDLAQGDKDIFLKLYEQMKIKIEDNPDMLYKDYWREGE